MKAIAVFCLVAMFCSVLAKSKKDDNKMKNRLCVRMRNRRAPSTVEKNTTKRKGLVPCLPCMSDKKSTRATFKRLTTKKWVPKRSGKPKKTIAHKPVTHAVTTEAPYTHTPRLLRTSENITKVKIAVYYESLCPDSKAFIVQQLAPVWRDFRGVIKVKLVPYGKATHDKVDGKWQFNCHHGADECYGNKIQSCILKDRILQDTDKMELVICLMSQTNPDKSLDTCLTQVNKLSESTKIKRCASGDQGDALLAAYGDKTDHISRPLSFVPTVIINEKFDQTTQDEAFSNLKSVVCRVATNKPSIC